MPTSDGWNQTQPVAVLGAGLIGRSWTALFVAAGLPVQLFDPDPRAESRVRESIEEVRPVLAQLGLLRREPGRLSVFDDPSTTVRGARFVQESVPEQIALKHEVYAAIEPALDPEAIVASSASGLTLTELQGGWRDPARLVLGHPFNPPHLIPLVEVMGNDRTAEGVVATARRFYESIGKVTIEVRREVAGHVANRLQAALWREAIHLVESGVATVEDVDTAVASGPGLRWAVAGPTELFHLGGDEGGLATFCERYADSFNRWWDDLGSPHLDPELVERLVTAHAAGRAIASNPPQPSPSIAELAAQRDRRLAAVVALTHPQENR